MATVWMLSFLAVLQMRTCDGKGEVSTHSIDSNAQRNRSADINPPHTAISPRFAISNVFSFSISYKTKVITCNGTLYHAVAHMRQLMKPLLEPPCQPLSPRTPPSFRRTSSLLLESRLTIGARHACSVFDVSRDGSDVTVAVSEGGVDNGALET